MALLQFNRITKYFKPTRSNLSNLFQSKSNQKFCVKYLPNNQNIVGSCIAYQNKIYLRSLHYSSAKSMKIYTKTGDKGNTSTFAGDRRSKSDDIFEALGTIDELTSCIGLVREYINISEPLRDQLFKIQCVLQDLAASVATPKSQARVIHLKRTEFDNTHVETLEKWIDNHTKELPELKNFIIPSGGKASSHLHIARAICRRAERKVLAIVGKNEVDEIVLIYLNRLSDYLFTVARIAAKLNNRSEDIYIKP